MKIKILVVPTLIVASGFIGLHYLKPDFDIYMQKRTVRDTAKANAMQADQIAQNVKALRSQIDVNSDKINFLKKYLPLEKDQGRTFDNLNFLTSQAGLVTSKIQISENIEEDTAGSETFATIDPLADADPLKPIDAGAVTGTAGIPQPVAYKAPEVKKYNVSLDAIGAYPNMKDLLSKLTAFDRMHKLTSFKIASSADNSTPTEGEGTSGGGNILTLTYNAELPYQATPDAVSGDAIVSIPGLSQGSFNFEDLENLQKTTTLVPAVVLGTEGKANPFVE